MKRVVFEAGKVAAALMLACSLFRVTNIDENSILFFFLTLLVYAGLSGFRRIWAGLPGRDRILQCLFAFIAAAATSVGNRVVIGEGGLYAGSFRQNYFVPFEPFDILWLLLFALLLLLGIVRLVSACGRYEARLCESDKPEAASAMFFIAWALILLCWLPYLLANWPGYIYEDSLSSIGQALTTVSSNHHPVAYTLLIRAFLRIGALFGDINTGCGLYTLFQMLVVSACFAYSLCRMRRLGLRLGPAVLVVAFYGVLPVMPLHAVSMWKDPMFAAGLLILSMELFETALERGENLQRPAVLARLALFSLAVCFLRNNGIYIVLLVWLVLTVMYGVCRHGRVRVRAFIAVGVVCCAAYFVITGPVYNVNGIKKPRIEAFAIPVQQLAYVAAEGGNVTMEERQWLDALLPVDDDPDAYTPCCVDNLKWHDAFRSEYMDDLSVFFSKWLSIGVKNPAAYCRAYVLETFEYWSFADIKRNTEPMYTDVLRYRYGIERRDVTADALGVELQPVLPQSFTFFSEGMLTWLMLFSALRLILDRRRAYLIVLLPNLLCLATLLVGAPLAGWHRHVLGSIYTLPLLLLLPALAQCAEKRRAKLN